jgi:hypothetical protein
MAIALRLATVTKGSMIIASGINNTSTSAPTPSGQAVRLNILLDFYSQTRQISVDFSKVLSCPPTIEICG